MKQHELPTHLNVEDKVLCGLTVRQFLYLLVGSSMSYTLWEQSSGTLEALRIGVVGACVCTTLVFAWVQPAGRVLEEWLLAAALYTLSPKRTTWRPREPDPADWRPAAGSWQELTPSLAWAETLTWPEEQQRCE